MIGIAIFIFIIFFFVKSNSEKNRMRSIRKQLDNSRTAAEAYGGSGADEAGSSIGMKRQTSSGKFAKPYRGRVKQTAAGHMHLKDNGLALEDREHDWLAMQLKEEARMKRSIDTDMHDLKEEHRRMHRRLNYG